jgi:hypothetical protein
MLRKLKENFANGIRDRVPFLPMHGAPWKATLGDVTDLEVQPDGLYAVIEVDEVTHNDLATRKVDGVSAGLLTDYLDKESGQRVGPVLDHLAATDRPYIRGLGRFEALTALADGSPVVWLDDENQPSPAATVTAETVRAAVEAAFDARKPPKPREPEPTETDERLADVQRKHGLTPAQARKVHGYAKNFEASRDSSAGLHHATADIHDVHDQRTEATLREAHRSLTPSQEMDLLAAEPKLRMNYPNASDDQLRQIARLRGLSDELKPRDSTK